MSSIEGRRSTKGETNEQGSPMQMGMKYARKLQPQLSKHARSGTMSGVTGGFTVLRGIRTMRRGKRLRGFFRLVFGLALVGIAVTQRRNARQTSNVDRDVDQSDVVSTGPDDLEAAATDENAGVEHHEDVSGIADTGADIDDVETDDRGEDLGQADVDEREVVDTGTDAADVESDQEADEESSETADAGSGDGTDEEDRRS